MIEHRDHIADKPAKRLSLPSPTPSALVGIAVLVLIGGGVIHLSSAGGAVPLEGEAVVTADDASPGTDTGELGASAGDGDPAEGTETTDDGTLDSSGAGDHSAEEPDTAPPGVPAAENGDPSGGSTELVVHVSGAVDSPGVVRLPAGSRIDDALRAAGGASADADLAAVNLARPVTDGEQIHVPLPGEDPPPGSSAQPAGGTPDTAGSSPGTDPDAVSSAGLIEINTASATELEELPGVGPAIAQRIIEHREKNGQFESVDGLLEVSGIGPATLEKIREKATV